MLTGKKIQDIKVLIVNPWHNEYSELIRKRYPELTLITAPDESHIQGEIKDVEVVLSYNTLADTLPRISRLKWFQALSAGVEHILKARVLSEDVILANAAGAASVPVSEIVISYMLYFVKMYQKLHEIKQKKELTLIVFEELYGKTVGILGLGNIGGAVAKKAKALDMKVIGYDMFVKEHDFVDRIYGFDGLNGVLEASDFLVIALPLTRATRNLIGISELKKMKRTSYLINIARAEIVVKEALETALKEGWISGCALDVFWSKKKDEFTHTLDAESDLWKMDNVILTPHSATITPMYVLRTCEIFFENLNRYIRGEPLINVVDKKLLELDM
jgi:phosphoglycerate dehydrogenase-like enzyme